MRLPKVLTLVLVLCLMTDCVPIPKRVGARRPIRQETLAFLEKEPVSRKDVLDHLGTPEDIIGDGRVYDYKWIGSWVYGSLIIASGSIETQKCNVLRFYFDANGMVQEAHVSSYKPKPLLDNNKDCQFNGVTASRLNVLKQRVSATHEFIKVGQTGRQEVLRRLGWVAVDLQENGLFWGRWTVSSSGLTSQSGRVETLPSSREKGQRKGMHNLLVEFDDRDVVVRAVEVQDKDVIHELVAWSRRSGKGRAPLSSLKRNYYMAWTEGLRRHDGSMRVNADSVGFYDQDTRGRFNVSIDRIDSLELRTKRGMQPACRLKFKDKTAWGNVIYVTVTSSELLTVLKYLAQINP